MHNNTAPNTYKERAKFPLHEPTDLFLGEDGIYLPAHPEPSDLVTAYYSGRYRPRPTVPSDQAEQKLKEANAKFYRQAAWGILAWLAVISFGLFGGYFIVSIALSALSGALAVAEQVGKWIAYVGGFVFAALLVIAAVVSVFSGRRRSDATGNSTSENILVNQTVIIQKQSK